MRARIECGDLAKWLGLHVRASRAHKEQQSRAEWQPAADNTIVVSEEPEVSELLTYLSIGRDQNKSS